jgi:glucose/arabinose dehydrogenase
MKRLTLALGLALGLAAALAAAPAAAVSLSLFDSGYTAPIFLTGRGNALYVVQQDGKIFSVNRATKVRSLFFTVPGVVASGELGVLGFAFDPGYNSNGRFYVNLARRSGGRFISEVRRYTDNRVAAEGLRLILRLEQPYETHKGGWIGFGNDGFLYVASGDGGAANDPENRAQDKASPLGKILRIDVRSDGFPADPLRNYAVPPINPFGTEILAYGLRNPFRASIDRTTGDLWLGDVGQDVYEEVNRIPARSSGQNFGWRALEGPIPTPGIGDPIPADTTPPVFFYDHGVGRSITGGYVYRGGGIAALDGRYVFGDFIAGRLWSIALDGSNPVEFTSAASGFGAANWSSFGEDGLKKLYVLDYGGRIFRVDP